MMGFRKIAKEITFIKHTDACVEDLLMGNHSIFVWKFKTIVSCLFLDNY